jgi:hypothetical protein
MSNTDPDIIDVELLEIAEDVLSDAGYRVDRVRHEPLDYLICEDTDGVVAVTAVVSADAVELAESLISERLAVHFAAAEANPKRWDGYAVVLTSGQANDSQSRALFSLSYNLAQMRRIVKVGVDATNAGVQRALRPVLPLASVSEQIAPGDALHILEQRLISDGVPAEYAMLAMAEFRSETPTVTDLDTDDLGEIESPLFELEDDDE